ncbi:hypothetical protein ACFL35_06135 [Candidatus Riflebacteria bacterium]
MKRLLFCLLILYFSTTPIWGSESAYSYVPGSVFAFATVDAERVIKEFFQFLNDENSQAGTLNQIYNKVFEKLATPLPEPHRSRGYFGDLSDSLKALQDPRIGHIIKKCHFFLLPGIVENQQSPDYFIVILEGQFEMARLRYFAERNNKGNVKPLHYMNFRGIEVHPGKDDTKGTISWAVKIGDTLMIGSKNLLSDVLKNKQKRPFFERKRFSSKPIKEWQAKKPYLVFYGRRHRRKAPYRWCLGGLDEDYMDIRVKMSSSKEVVKYVKNMNMRKDDALRIISGFESSKMIPVTDVSMKGFAEARRFFENFTVTDKKKGRVLIRVKNPGMNGFCHILGGFGDFLLSGWVKAAQMQKKGEL